MAGVAQTQHEKSAQPPTYQQTLPLATPTNPPQYQPPTEQPSTAHYAALPSNQAWQAPSSSVPPPPTYNAQYIVQQPGTYVYQTHPQTFQTSNQQSVTVIQANTAPQDYFSFSLFVMLCCCLPLGIVAIVKSGEVKTKASVGDMAGARMASMETKRYAWIGCSIGLIIWIVGIICLSVWIAFIVKDCSDGYC
ncbi:proline-rich transmembrane protein 1-like [Lytechinus pictus]|uniref:proline-rich transmembrane protein 1-like n=1 Tax=Lytechinus pictus TaxID=7653 RepID=UPI0030B9E868